jgi:ComF family protein
VWVCSTYNNTAKKLVHLLKFNFTRSAAALMAAEMSKIMPRLPAHTIIVHVSAVSSHIRQRGFDQSALIARELSYLLSLPHMHVLGRLGQKRQVGASRSTREEQLKDAFRPLSLPTIQGAHVLLVDDVLTTGSTLEEAARTLREAGATSVSAVVFAQAK